jgi:hypothetical protein
MQKSLCAFDDRAAGPLGQGDAAGERTNVVYWPASVIA